MDTTPFNIHAPNTFGIGLYFNIVPEVKEGYTEFRVYADDRLVTVLSLDEAGKWEWVGGDDPGKIDFGFIKGQIESNL